MSSVRTPLSCGHYYDGVHMGPDAWCVLCLDFSRVSWERITQEHEPERHPFFQGESEQL